MASISDLAPVVSSVAVVVAIVFGVLTLRQWSSTRYLAAAAELVHSIQTPEFTRSIAKIVALPEGADADLLRKDPELLNASYAVSHVFESLGVLVFHRVLPLHLVDHLIGGYVRASWKRMAPHVERGRVEMGAHFGEWFQWLAQRMEAFPAPGKKEGAHVAHADWRP